MRRYYKCGLVLVFPVLVWLMGVVLSSSAVTQRVYAASYVTAGDGGWEAVMPSLGARQWSGVHFIDDKTGWIVGNRCVIMKTTDGGKNWALQGPRIDKFMYDICFTDKNHGWVVGSGYRSDDQTGVILKTSDSGATWKTVLDGKTDGLRSVYFVNNDVGWAVGGMPGKAGVILKTTDGGETWYKQDCGVSLTDKQNRVFEGVTFIDESTGYVLGSTDGQLDLYKTTDGGQSWSRTLKQCKGHASAIQFVDANTGWILTTNLILGTTDGGKTWTEHSLGKARYVYSFHFSDAQNGVVMTSNDGILRTGDGGKTWKSAVPGLGGIHPSVQMVDSKNGWAVGDYSILRTSDGGSTWQALSAGLDRCVLGGAPLGPKAACAVGYTNDIACLVLRTEDDWQTCSRQVLPVKGQLLQVCFADDKNGWATCSSGEIAATKDGGKTWQMQDTGNKAGLYGLQFIDAETGWAVGADGTAIRTTDGGATWTKLDTGTMDPLCGVFFLDKNTGWISGANGRVMKTTDGGKTWKRLSTGVAVGLGGVFFTDENTGWSSGNVGSVLKTTDGGATWAKQDSGTKIPMGVIYFANKNEGWIAGNTMVHTSDGGRTWTAQDFGSLGVWAMYFTDANNGWTFGSEILRTTTGGLPGAVWAKKQPDGAPANFGHLVVTKKSEGYLLAEHPDSRIGIHIKTSDAKPNVGDYIYVHGKIATENSEKIIAADSIDIQCAGWGILPAK